MHAILIALVAAAPLLYQAKIQSFGCSSTEEVSKLQQMRVDKKAFQTELLQQIFYGQCVAINKGMLVDGSTEVGNPSMLLVDSQIEPPGYLAPLGDFEKPTDSKK